MKNVTALVLALSLVVTANFAQARDNGADGFFLGAGSGALIGQAIGRNTEATLIGTAVGSMLGYIVGNEMDNATGGDRRVTYRSPVRQYSRTRHVEYLPPSRTQTKPVCRETQMFAEINGRAEKVYGTACMENGEWVVANSGLASRTIFFEKNRHRQSKRNAYYKRVNHKRSNRFNNRGIMHRPVW